MILAGFHLSEAEEHSDQYINFFSSFVFTLNEIYLNNNHNVQNNSNLTAKSNNSSKAEKVAKKKGRKKEVKKDVVSVINSDKASNNDNASDIKKLDNEFDTSKFLNQQHPILFRQSVE